MDLLRDVRSAPHRIDIGTALKRRRMPRSL